MKWNRRSEALAVSVSQRCGASGFPRAGSAPPQPPPVNTSIILQVDWLDDWIRHSNQTERPAERRQLASARRCAAASE